MGHREGDPKRQVDYIEYLQTRATTASFNDGPEDLGKTKTNEKLMRYKWKE